MEETWKPVVGYEGVYSVSDQGRVMRNSKGRVLKNVIGAKGYAQVSLSMNNVASTHLVHALVMRAHVGPCPAGLEVCHDDGDPANPKLANLRYDTHAANLNDRRAHGTASTNPGEANGQAKLTEDHIRAIRAYPRYKGSRNDIASIYGIGANYVSDIRSRRAWPHVA